jgi:hypothetical protein
MKTQWTHSTSSIAVIFMPCHPERRKIVRSRTILRSRGTCFLPVLTRRPPTASRRHESHLYKKRKGGPATSYMTGGMYHVGMYHRPKGKVRSYAESEIDFAAV